MTVFQYHPDIIENYPNIVGAIIIAKDMRHAIANEALTNMYQLEQEAVKARIGDTPLSEIPSLSAWRSAISAFGVSPTKYRSAAEALLRRLTKKGDIPSINVLVDIGNLISIRYGLPVAILDTRQIEGAITVHYAKGNEKFEELTTNEVVFPEAGEVIFSDEQDMCVARRWCWRQSASSAANTNTTDAIITIEAHHDNAYADIENAMNDILELFHTYTMGTFESTILTADNPSI